MGKKEHIEEYQKLNRDFMPSEFMKMLDFFGETPPIKLFEALRKHYQAKSQKIITETLLEEMEEDDIDLFETPEVKASIKRKVTTKTVNKEALHNWLIDNGYSDVIKETASFPKGEFTEEIKNMVEELGASFTLEGTAPAASVKKIISDRLTDGEEIPGEDVISVSSIRFVDIKVK